MTSFLPPSVEIFECKQHSKQIICHHENHINGDVGYQMLYYLDARANVRARQTFFLSQNMHSIDHFMRTLDVFIVVDVVYVTWKQRLFILLPNKKRYLQSNQNSTF